MIDRIEDLISIEDLLLATLDAVSRFRVGQREAIGAALDAGALLSKAKGRLQHGEWGNWLNLVGLAPRTASMWMKLAAMDLTAEEVIERGGIVQTLRGGTPKSATVADLPDSNLGREASLSAADDLRWRLHGSRGAVTPGYPGHSGSAEDLAAQLRHLPKAAAGPSRPDGTRWSSPPLECQGPTIGEPTPDVEEQKIAWGLGRDVSPALKSGL